MKHPRPIMVSDFKSKENLIVFKTRTEASVLTGVGPSLVSEVLRGDTESSNGYSYRDLTVEEKEKFYSTKKIKWSHATNKYKIM